MRRGNRSATSIVYNLRCTQVSALPAYAGGCGRPAQARDRTRQRRQHHGARCLARMGELTACTEWIF
eukprot:5080476-Pleurochrysis_carterae.AAC.1